MALLEMRALRRTLQDGQRRFVIDVPKFELRSGDRKAIIGKTGSGKTSVLDMFALATSPDHAECLALTDADERNWPDLTELGAAALSRLRARNFGYVLQTSPLFPFLTGLENAELGQRIAGRCDTGYLRHLLYELGLELLPSTRVANLSIGQRQRLAIARALAHRPAFVLCDEPTAALDPETAETLMRLLMRLADESQTAVLIVTHEADLALAHGCTLYRMTGRDDGLTGSRLLAAEEP